MSKQIETVLDKLFPDWKSLDSYIKVRVEEKEIQLHIDHFTMEELEQLIAFCKEQDLSFKLEAASIFCFVLKLVKE